MSADHDRAGFVGIAEHDSQDLDRVRKLLQRVTYKPNWTIDAIDIGDPWAPLYLVTSRLVPNSYRPTETVRVQTRSVIAPPLYRAPEDHFYDWLRTEMLAIESHELDEFLRVDGEMRWDPHADDWVGKP